MKVKMNWMQGWLKSIAESKEQEIIPPFCVELVMRDGRSYYLQYVTGWEGESGTAVLSIWDFRALSDQDKEIVKLKISKFPPKEIDGEGKNLHPHLDRANLRVNIKDIMYCIKWHDRTWPLGVEAIKMYEKK